MGHITALLSLIRGASSLADALQKVDSDKYKAELEKLMADGRTLLEDMKALEQQAQADFEALKPQ